MSQNHIGEVILVGLLEDCCVSDNFIGVRSTNRGRFRDCWALKIKLLIFSGYRERNVTLFDKTNIRHFRSET